MAQPDLGELEAKLGYVFKDRTLLERALTHRSWAHEHVAPGEELEARRLHNEALEFVGDSVLGLAVADYLFQSTADATEGDLSRMKHRLVSTMMLARVARRLDLGDYLRIGRGEEKTGGRRKRALLADVVEAIIAAVYLDGGIEEADRRTPSASGGLFQTEDLQNAVKSFLDEGPGKATFEGK